MERRITAGKPIKVFFKQVQAQDIRKFYNRSNDSKTGGGARDLRVSPYGDLWEPLKDFFPNEISSRELQGLVLSKIGEAVESANIELMAPTNARPGECRICVISRIMGWRISEEEYSSKINEGHEWFFLLALDVKNQVWASKFCTDSLERMHPRIRERIRQEILNKRGKKAITGITLLT